MGDLHSPFWIFLGLVHDHATPAGSPAARAFSQKISSIQLDNSVDLIALSVPIDMKHQSAIQVVPEDVIKTPDPERGPWMLRCGFEVGPFTLPVVIYFVEYITGGSPSWSGQWCLLNASRGTPKWDLVAVGTSILQEGYRKREVPEPSQEKLKDFLLESRRLLIEAHIARVAHQFGSELSSEDVSRIWGMEDVKMVMES